jgi:hypothetical protein
MSINTYTECTCDRCGETVQVEALPPGNLPPVRWMLVHTTATKKGKDGVFGADGTRIVCPSCAALVIEVLTPLRRKKRRS